MRRTEAKGKSCDCTREGEALNIITAPKQEHAAEGSAIAKVGHSIESTWWASKRTIVYC